MSCSGLDVPRRTELTPSFLRHHAVDSMKQEFVDVLELTTNITELLAVSSTCFSWMLMTISISQEESGYLLSKPDSTALKVDLKSVCSYENMKSSSQMQNNTGNIKSDV